MSSITHLWNKSKESFDAKTLSQILAFAGDGKLRDGNTTSQELRELLEKVPSRLLRRYSDDCLTIRFEESGLALQDIINQIGSRLGFTVEHGLYRGNKNEIGYDGIWTSDTGHAIIVEVKTTDTYRINLDIIATYRNRLIENKRVDQTNSSILIVVGRDDTGDLEAQIRGSKHAWDIRIISTESLIKLLTLKETLNDTKTIEQINELLKPREYTRIDKLIELIFETSKDLQLEDVIGVDQEVSIPEKTNQKTTNHKFTPVNFREDCINKIQSYLKVNFVKQSRVAYTNKEKSIGMICSISKVHDPGKNESFWFSLYPHQQDFLKEIQTGYFAYGCGSADTTFMIPYVDFEPFIEYFSATENDERMYFHVVILHREKKYLLQQPKNPKKLLVDITKYKI